MTISVMPLTVLQLYNHDPITIISVTSCILSRLDQNLAEKNRVHAKSVAKLLNHFPLKSVEKPTERMVSL